jgi:hypothetical protein
MSEKRYERPVAMPNEIFADMRKWLEVGELKSPHHQEFIYCFYWMIAYLWNYAKYGEHGFTLPDIKRLLGYNPNEKRLNYIIKKNGLLDQQGYSSSVNDYPILWHMDESKRMSFTMLSDYHKEDKDSVSKYKSANVVIKAPLKSIGNEQEDGLFWNPSNSHMIRGEIMVACTVDGKMNCSAVYMYGLLLMLHEKNKYHHKVEMFQCANKTLIGLTGWEERKVIRVANFLLDVGLIKKSQAVRKRGQANWYSLV